MTGNMTMQERKERVAELAERFKRGEASYKQASFNEASTRGQFLNAFLEALGWDVSNAAGARRGYESVVVEDNVAIDGGIKHTDYTLCIGGVKRLVVEAKKPAVHIKSDREPAIQGRRYSRTLKLPAVIVTNFAEWAVYDAGVKLNPRKDTAATARMEYITCEQYADKFEELYSRFSYDAVLKGDFAAWCGDTSDKRGTETVDDEFLGMIERWRESLALSIARHNDIDDDAALTAAVQRIIDRIVFLRIAEGKGIETFGALRDAAGRDGAYKKLNTLFARANDKFNAGLFAPDKNNDVEHLNIEDKALRGILGELYEPDCHYDFAALPVEILGSVYERFLGRVVRLGRKTAGGHSVKVEDKPEVQKAGGVYYTPDYIVDYIVRETIGRAVEGKRAEEVAAMRFCDPACGSGSFLVGAYRYLLDWHLTQYTQDAAHIKRAVKEKRIYEAATSVIASDLVFSREGETRGGKQSCGTRDCFTSSQAGRNRNDDAGGRDCFMGSQAGRNRNDDASNAGEQNRNDGTLGGAGERNRNDGMSGIYRLSIAEKKRILTANIYGVDIDAQAVEVTKLSLFLKILEDEEAGAGELFKVSDTVQGKILPNMGDNIKCGNSLIGSDYWQGAAPELFDDHKYFRSINTFDWERAFPQVFAPRLSVIARDLTFSREGEARGGKQSCGTRDCFMGSQAGRNRNDDAGERDCFTGSQEGRNRNDDAGGAGGRNRNDDAAGGFDCVIGNPPYVSAPNMVALGLSDQRAAIAKSPRFKTLCQKWDLYIPFVELGLTMLKSGGYYGAIIPLPFTNQTYGKLLRQAILRDNRLLSIADLSGVKVFAHATVTNCIPIVQKAEPKEECAIVRPAADDGTKLQTALTRRVADLAPDEKTAVWNLGDEVRHANRHEGMHTLGDYCYISKGMVLNSDENAKRGKFKKADLISETKDDIHCKEYIEAKDIDRYKIKRVRYLEYGTKRCPDKLSRPTFPELYTTRKLLFNCLGDMKVSVDIDGHFYCEQAIRMAVLWKDLRGVENKSITSSVKKYSRLPRSEMETLSEGVDLLFLLAMMNSSYAHILLTDQRGTDYHIVPEHIRALPIPPAAPHEQAALADKARRLMALHGKQDADEITQKQIEVLEAQVDAEVRRLYGAGDDDSREV